MPSTQIREIAAAQRLDNVRYAIRDLASVADEVTRQGHKVLALNVGDPNIFDFKTPPHLIEAVHKAMRRTRTDMRRRRAFRRLSRPSAMRRRARAFPRCRTRS